MLTLNPSKRLRSEIRPQCIRDFRPFMAGKAA